MKRIVIAGVVGGVVLFMWAFVSWWFLPWHQIQKLPGEESIAQAMRDADVPDGAYWLPSMDREATETMTPDEQTAVKDAWEEKYSQGPVALIMYQKEGSSPMPILTFIVGIVLDVIVAGIAAFLLSMAAPAIPSFVR